MFASRIFPIAVALVLSAAAVAQEAPAPAPAPPAAASTMPHDCAKPMARHDHGAEKGTPTPMSPGCPMATSGSSAKAKAKPNHEHSRFHKLM